MFGINTFIHIGIFSQGMEVDEDLAVLSSSNFHFGYRAIYSYIFYRNLVTFNTVDSLSEETVSIS